MEDRDDRKSPRSDRAQRLATALRANLKRRKARARGRSGLDEPLVQGENRPDQSNLEGEDRSG